MTRSEVYLYDRETGLRPDNVDLGLSGIEDDIPWNDHMRSRGWSHFADIPYDLDEQNEYVYLLAIRMFSGEHGFLVEITHHESIPLVYIQCRRMLDLLILERDVLFPLHKAINLTESA